MRARSMALAALTSAGLYAAAPAVAAGPPPPTATQGQTVTLVASGLKTPTAFAFGGGAVFEADGGAEQAKVPNGGVYLLTGGKGVRLAGSPLFVSGIAWHRGALYVAGGTFVAGKPTWQLQRWSGFDGARFARRTVIWTAPKGFDGFNGIAFGPNGLLYVGVDVGLTDNNDHGPAKTPYVYSILTFRPDGRGMTVYARGMRQPWQLAFAPGSSVPFVSDLGQDKGAADPPDFVLRVRRGDDYGFPSCNWTAGSRCAGRTRPFKRFAPHTDIMGLAVLGGRLYMTSFAGPDGKGPGGQVLSMSLRGGATSPFVTGFVAPVVGLGAHAGTLYVGELTGQVFAVRP